MLACGLLLELLRLVRSLGERELRAVVPNGSTRTVEVLCTRAPRVQVHVRYIHPDERTHPPSAHIFSGLPKPRFSTAAALDGFSG